MKTITNYDNKEVPIIVGARYRALGVSGEALDMWIEGNLSSTKCFGTYVLLIKNNQPATINEKTLELLSMPK